MSRAWLAFDQQCAALGLPEPVPEYRFHVERKWRTDYCWPAHKLAIEIEGGAWTAGRHTRGAGFLADMVKYNELAILGYRLLRVTPAQVKNGEAVMLVKRLFAGMSLVDSRHLSDLSR